MDGRVVRWERDIEAVGRVAPVSVVLGVVVQKARETILAARDGSGLEEVGEEPDDVFDVVISRGARDGEEVRCDVSEEGICVLRRRYGVMG